MSTVVALISLICRQNGAMMNNPAKKVNFERVYKVLIVDDIHSNIRLLEEALKNWERPHAVASAGDCDEALRLIYGKPGGAQGCRPDLILLDLNMAEHDGFDILGILKSDADPDIRSIPVVVFSTSDSPSDVSRSYELGCNCYMQKPTELNRFFEVVTLIESFWCGAVTLPDSRPDARAKPNKVVSMDLAVLSRRTNRNREVFRELEFELVSTELELGLTFMKLAVSVSRPNDDIYYDACERKALIASEKANRFLQEANHLDATSRAILQAKTERLDAMIAQH